MNRTEVLEAARHCVCGERQQDYGSPENNFANIAALWEAYTGRSYTPVEVAVMLALLKVARIKSGRKADNFVDLAGYAALAGELADLETAAAAAAEPATDPADVDQEPAAEDQEPAAEDQEPAAEDQEPERLPAWVEDLKSVKAPQEKAPRECWPVVCESCRDAALCNVAPQYLSHAAEDQDPAADQDQDPAADQDQDPAADQDQDPAADQDQDPAADQDQEPVADQDQEPENLSPLELFVRDLATTWNAVTADFARRFEH